MAEREPRRYELGKRAESMEETRRRIAAATFELHTLIGPKATTISAIAERAGVQRWTVYRHFPDDLSLFTACVAHGFGVMPSPDPESWLAIADPQERVRTALAELYAFYRETESAWDNILRDLPTMPALIEANAPVVELWARMTELLSEGWGAKGRRKQLVQAVAAHALDFHAWRQLARDGQLTDAEIVELMTSLFRSAAGAR